MFGTSALGNLKLQGRLFSNTDDTTLIISESNCDKPTQSAESDLYKIN